MSLFDFSKFRVLLRLNLRLFRGHVQIWSETLIRGDRLAVIRDYRLLRRSMLFDKRWYRGEYPDVAGRYVDPLLHYLVSGGQEGRKPNPVFDSRWYLAKNPDVAASGMNPLVHYVRHGASERRDPGPGFSLRKYLAHYPDVAEAGMDPLQHYLRFGRQEGRGAGKAGAGGKWQAAAKPAAPDDAVWAALARQRPSALPEAISVDVVVPVYRGWHDTLACLHSVLVSSNRSSFDLVVVDDGSPEPELSKKLDELRDLGLITLVRNEENLGFVRSCNKAMALHEDRDIVLLNSDTVVYGDWLDRLLAHGRGARVGTVTPFSTNATICSYPVPNGDNPEKLELGYAALDRLLKSVNKSRSVEMPTGVGFCMYIARSLLDEIGLFDEAAFGRGYGEENDLCQRAIAAGWRNLLAGDVFVRHTGGVSFAEAGAKARREGMQALTAKHPNYTADVRSFIRRNPAASLRRRIDAARVAKQSRRNVLFVSHTWGGGVDRHMRDLAALFNAAERGTVYLRPSHAGGISGDLSARDIQLPNLRGLDFLEVDEMAEILSLAGIKHIHVHSLAGWDLRLLNALPQIAKRMGVPLDFTFHDFMAICPRINMIDHTGAFCGGPERRKCNACLRKNGSLFGVPDITSWHETFERFLSATRLRIAPSGDTARRVQEVFPHCDVAVRPHPEHETGKRVARPWQKGERLRVVLLGAITEHKGSRVLLKAAENARRRGLPLDFIVVGYTDRDNALRKNDRVRMTGVYKSGEVSEILEREKAHLALIPSVWPETYCYTLSELLLAGFPVALFPMGAPYERLKGAASRSMIVLPEEGIIHPGKICDVLLGEMEKISLPQKGDVLLPSPNYTYSTYYDVAV